jgi:hypothetical protein
MMQLEALSSDVFAPLSEKEASLVVGGMAAAGPIIGVTYYDTIALWSNGTWSEDALIVDTINAL